LCSFSQSCKHMGDTSLTQPSVATATSNHWDMRIAATCGSGVLEWLARKACSDVLSAKNVALDGHERV
jgi:hypothetical protein